MDNYTLIVGSGVVCEGCGALVERSYTETHDQFHARLHGVTDMAADAHRLASSADSLTRPIGG